MCVKGHPLNPGRGRWFVLHDGEKFIMVFGTRADAYRDGPYCGLTCIATEIAERNQTREITSEDFSKVVGTLGPELCAEFLVTRALLREAGKSLNEGTEADLHRKSMAFTYLSPIGMFRLTLEKIA